MIRLILLCLLLLASSARAAGDDERLVKPVQFKKGKSATTLSGSIKGYRTIDYQIRAAAGQTLKLSLKGSNLANYFNLLPPDSPDAAMAVGELSDNRFEGMLPDDGVYTIRVFLMRAAARRHEISGFRLAVALEGRPLAPLSAKTDALIPGTRYHASGTVPCAPAFTQTRECAASVVRRSRDGTATVALRWDMADRAVQRRILFVRGEPVAADVPLPLTFVRDERGWRVRLGDDESFEIPEALVFGG